MKTRIWLVASLVIVGVACIASYYRGFDDLDRVAWTTQSLLKEYERTNDPSDLIIWATTQHGAGGDKTLALHLLAWSYDHPQKFEQFIDSVPTDKLADLAMGLAVEEGPTRSDSRFNQVFNGSSSIGVESVFTYGGLRPRNRTENSLSADSPEAKP